MPQSEIKYENKITKWFHNYWYYYKWKVIIAAFLIFVVIVCSVQVCSNTKADITVMYAGPFLSSSAEVPNITAAIESLAKDYNDDGEVKVGLAMMNVYSKEQMDAINNEQLSEINGQTNKKIDYNANQSELDKFQNLIVTGEYYLCMLDPWLYDMVAEENGFTKLSDILGYTPEYAVSEYAVRLSDTEFGKYYEDVAKLPKDTYLCLRVPGSVKDIFGNDKNERYDQAAELLRAIIEFKAPN